MTFDDHTLCRRYAIVSVIDDTWLWYSLLRTSALDFFNTKTSNLCPVFHFAKYRIVPGTHRVPAALFYGKAEPADIEQGELGDCWLMTGLGCLASVYVVTVVDESLFYVESCCSITSSCACKVR